MLTCANTCSVLYRTPKGIPIDLHTHLGTSSGVNFVLINYRPDHISFAAHSCPVDYVVSINVSIVKQWIHLWDKVVDGAHTALHCSLMQCIASTLQKGINSKWIHDCYGSGPVHFASVLNDTTETNICYSISLQYIWASKFALLFIATEIYITDYCLKTYHVICCGSEGCSSTSVAIQCQ